mmetsp:Transcript_35609/g.80358  ORF Transcript_35609/g.80358 Transcript_35609/m.80358 type:complete len:257 (-) Transcript_35609:165-935(-)
MQDSRPEVSGRVADALLDLRIHILLVGFGLGFDLLRPHNFYRAILKPHLSQQLEHLEGLYVLVQRKVELSLLCDDQDFRNLVDLHLLLLHRGLIVLQVFERLLSFSDHAVVHRPHHVEHGQQLSHARERLHDYVEAADGFAVILDRFCGRGRGEVEGCNRMQNLQLRLVVLDRLIHEILLKALILFHRPLAEVDDFIVLALVRQLCHLCQEVLGHLDEFGNQQVGFVDISPVLVLAQLIDHIVQVRNLTVCAEAPC